MNNVIKDARTISIIFPTRNRPKNIKRLIESVLDTANNPRNIEICCRVDYDDIASVQMLVSLSKDINIKIHVGANYQCHGHYWNEAWKLATGDVVQMSGDDFEYRTKGWDSVILEEINKYEDKIAFVYGRDGIWDGTNMGTHFFIHRRWPEALGRFIQTETNVYYQDTWPDEVAKKLGRNIYLKELCFYHLHWSQLKTPRDKTTREMQAKATNDGKLFKGGADKREAEAQILRGLMNE